MEIKIIKARNSLLALALLIPTNFNLELLGGQNVKNIELVENVFNKPTENLDSIKKQMDASEKASNFFKRVKSILETQKAIDLYEEIIKRHENKLGTENLEFAEYLNILAILYSDQGLYEKSETLQLRSNLITERILGTDHQYTGIGKYNLASVYKDQGLYEKAIDSSLKSLSIMEKNFGKEDIKLVRHLSQLAGLYVDQGIYYKAEPLYLKALSIREKKSGPEHPDTAIVMNNLALLYQDKGLYEKAEKMLLKVLDIGEKTYGKNNIKTSIT